jgi:hypothetical protein
MGADGFLAYYGLRWDVTDPDEISQLEKRSDPRIVAARDNGLKHWWGVTEDQERHFLLIGTELSNLGWEGDPMRTISDSEFSNLAKLTREKLRMAGFEESPALHFQFEPDY